MSNSVGLSLSEWRKQRADGEPAILPSELQVRLKRVAAVDLALTGDIPAALQTQIEAVISGGAGEVTLAKFREFSSIINLVCQACIVSPADLNVEELDYQDRLAIFQWANEVGAPLQTFRQQQAPAVELSPNRDVVLDETQ